MDEKSQAERKLVHDLDSLTLEILDSSLCSHGEGSQVGEPRHGICATKESGEPTMDTCNEAVRDTSAAEASSFASAVHLATSGGESLADCDAASSAESCREASGRMEAAGSALLDLWDEGWFAGNVAGWFAGRFFGKDFSLTTIKEAQNEADDQCDDDGDRGGGNDEGGVGVGDNADVECSSGHLQFASPMVGESCHGDNLGAATESPVPDADAGGVNTRGRRRTVSPYSSDEESVQSGSRAGRRRGRSGARRRAKRSSSAENARGTWFGELQQAQATEAGGARADRAARLPAVNTPPSRFSVQRLEDQQRPGPGGFMRTRSVSEYETKRGVVPSLWDTPPASKSKPRSLTDADVEELQGFVDLGFKFQQNHISPEITATLPALRLYQAVGNVQQKILSQRHSATAASNAQLEPSASLPVPAASSFESGDSDGSSSASVPSDVTWSIADPSDNPVDVKNTLRLWAQAVASTVRQTC